MGSVMIQNYTCKNPITMIGFEAGICWGADTADEKKNYRRGLDCLESGHGRTFEFPDVYLTLEGYSARVIREWYTHIGGQPTRLQASTRYINYEHGFDYVIPPSIAEHSAAKAVYDELMAEIQKHLARLDELGVRARIPRWGCRSAWRRGSSASTTCEISWICRARGCAAVHITNTAHCSATSAGS